MSVGLFAIVARKRYRAWMKHVQCLAAQSGHAVDLSLTANAVFLRPRDGMGVSRML